MPIKIITLPASSGKTTWVVNQVRKAGAGLRSQPRVILPSRQQVWDVERRLAKAGGMLGTKIGTINDLASEIVELSGSYPLLLSELVQAKVLQDILQNLDLNYYQAIVTKPGFVRSCLGIVRELKAGGITPEEFGQAAEAISKGPRLIELGLIYSVYSVRLQENGWADRAGLAWMAVDAMAKNPSLCSKWEDIYLDGFDDLTPVQLKLISTLAARIAGVYFTITGSIEGKRRELVHKRFLRLRDMLNASGGEDLHITSWEPEVPESPASKLERTLFDYECQAVKGISDQVQMVAVPDREAEARTALRWVRSKILTGQIKASETAVLVRDLEPYRGLISRIAAEYKIPVRIQGGLPLTENPLIATVIKLAQLISQGKEGLVWYEVISIWRSPYLNWGWVTAHPEEGCSRSDHLADTKRIEEVIRWGKVMQGYSQWEEAFQLLIGQLAEAEDLDTGLYGASTGLPRGRHAKQLWEKFSDFVDLITPPDEISSRSGHIAWFESLLGGFDPEESLVSGFAVATGILAGPADITRRDWKALEALNGIFREQIKAERLLGSPPIKFSQFSEELESIINQSSYQPLDWNESAVYCAVCTESRGLSFQSAAVLGLAEGEFPGSIKEDPFLRDEERSFLREKFDLPLRLSVDSAEGEYFYEALTRATKDLLITRPRIADNGAAWQPSPYWEEVQRVTNINPAAYTARSAIQPHLAANQAELLQIISREGSIPPDIKKSLADEPSRKLQDLERAKTIILERTSPGDPTGFYNGNLSNRSAQIAGKYPGDYVWSPSRLESYQTCPFKYLIGNLLDLEKPEQPEEGLDARQWGNVFHRILETLYRRVAKDYTIDDLLLSLPEVAASIFKEAPRQEGFRETAWWKHTQREILDKLRLSLIALENIDPGYRFHAAEKRFGLRPGEEDPVVVDFNGNGTILLRGIIDRVDINERGDIRVIDYKTSGKYGFDNRAVREGKKLQLPIYALAAQEGLKIGQVKEGFYFHVMAAEPSSFKLSTYRDEASGGPEAAIARVSEMACKAVDSIKVGSFPPIAPENGCPDYCPAVDFCWQYKTRNW